MPPLADRLAGLLALGLAGCFLVPTEQSECSRLRPACAAGAVCDLTRGRCVPPGAMDPGQVLFQDDFSDRTLARWNPYGDPGPIWIEQRFGRSGLFDNNGDASFGSGSASRDRVTCAPACVITADVYVDYSNPSGCWDEPSIGLTRYASEPDQHIPDQVYDGADGVYLALWADGAACTGEPAENRRPKFNLGLSAEDGQGDGPGFRLSAESYLNRWVNLAIVIGPDRLVGFFADGTLLWRSTKKIHPEVISDRNVMLGSRSSGSAGYAFHDWIRVLKLDPAHPVDLSYTQPDLNLPADLQPPPDQGADLSSGN